MAEIAFLIIAIALAAFLIALNPTSYTSCGQRS